MDFLSLSDLPDAADAGFTQLHHEYIGYQSLTDVPKAQSYAEKKTSMAEFQDRSTPDIIAAIQANVSLPLTPKPTQSSIN